MSEEPEPAPGRIPGGTVNSSPPPASERRMQRSPGPIARRRLQEMLGSLRPLTVVSAPAGYGKSTLMESWLAESIRTEAVARLSLEDDNLSPEAWWLTLEEALTVAGVAVSRADVTGGLRDPHRARSKALAADIATHGRRVVLIVDCGELSLSAQV